MTLTYRDLEIELQTEGIISIDSLHITQKLNEHGRAVIKAVIEEEKAAAAVEQALSSLSVRIRNGSGKKQAVFCGKIEQIRAEKENGMFYLYMDFSGYTREWDLTDKSQSFCKGNDTYEQVIRKALSEYGQALIRDEVTGGAKIPGMLMQYEETDWEFLKRLASHFSTYVLADNTAEYGKAYIGIPHIDNGAVLAEEEYVLLKGREGYEKSEKSDGLMPQEMMRWRVRSRRQLQPGEQVMLGHIETVVTAVDIRTEQGDLIREYELSRRKGILTGRKSNPRIYGMSIPATVKERKGNQIRVQMDIDPSYEPSGDLKWFTYAIETSNFYCMPEEGSRVHIYFPGHEEQSAMAVHALRMGGSAASGSHSGANAPVSAPVNVPGNSSYNSGADNGAAYYGGSDDGGSAGGGGSFSAPRSAGAGPAGTEQKAEEEKDPEHKRFSDPSGSYLELAPYGITFAPGGGSAAMTLQKTGMLSLTGLAMNFNTNLNIMIGTGKDGSIPQVCVEAEESMQLTLSDKSSQITMGEETNIISAFVKKDAALKLPAQPLAADVRADLTAEDAQNRADANAQSKDSLQNMALQLKEELLAEKQKEAEAKVRNGIFSILTVVASVAVVVATGGAALPLAIAIGASGAFKTASAVADIAEGLSDMEKVKAGDLSQSYNFMRDSVFRGNEALYEGAKAVNDMIFGFVTGKAVSGNLSNVENANKLVKTINSAQKFMGEHKKLGVAFKIGKEAVCSGINDYVQNGSINPVNVVSGTLKGLVFDNMRIGCKNPHFNFNSNFTRKALNVTGQTLATTGIDYVSSRVNGEPFDLKSSLAENFVTSSLGEVFAEPVDAVTGAYLMTASDMLLPDIREAVRLERSYSSTRRQSGWLGKGWRFPYEGRLARDGETFHVQLPDGYVAAFVRNGEEFTDTIGNGRFRLKPDLFAGKWHVLDSHEHKDYRYSESGLLEAVTDRNGNALEITYNGEYPVKMVTPLGYEVTFAFSKGKLAGMADDTGRCMEYHYEGDLLTEVVHMDGGVTRYQYSEEGYLTRPTDQTGLTYLSNEYDAEGRVVLQTLANGDTYTASYHDREKMVCVEYSAYPGMTQYFYDDTMAVREVRYPDGSSKTSEYDGKHNRILETDRLGRSTRWEYDSEGHLTKETRPEGLITEYIYDEAGDLEAVRDNGGREKLLAYDACHNLISGREKTADNSYTEQIYAYDHMGRLIKETDREGHEITYTYEEDSAYPSCTAYSDGTVLRSEYSRTGRKLTEDDGAVRWEYAYNKGGWRTMEKDGEGNETHYLYDGMGRKLAMYTPKQWKEKNGKRTDYRYDFLERLTDTAHPDGSHERLLRDGEGNIIKKVHPNAYDAAAKDGEGITYDYDGENRLHRIHYPDGGVERFLYDPAGNRIKHILPEQYDEKTDDGAGWSYTYDEANRLTSVTGPDGTQEAAYRYDLWGNCVQKSDEKGYITYLAYDLAGRLTRELAPIGDGTEDKEEASYRMTTYSYDNNGNRTGEIRHGGSYDKDGNLLTTGEDLALTFRYDARNRLAGVEDSMGASVTYRYDARGNRISEEQSINSGDHEACRKVLRKIRYTYDKAGRMVQKKEILDDGLQGTAAQTFTTAVTGYTYDENGNIIHITTPEGCKISRTYDCMDRLLEECLEDKANGICRTTYLTYDKAGNITSVRQTGQDGRERKLFYAYDLQDRLTYAGEQDGLRINLSYDKNGRRIEQRQLLPAEEESYAATSFLYDIRGNLTERYRNGLLEERNQYDIRGNRTSATDGDGIEASHRYGIQDEMIETYTINSRKQGRAAQKLTYDARGRITGVEDGCGGQTSYSLDGWGRITGIHTPEGGQEQYAYDQAGNITKTVDAKGGVIRYAYNSQGKVCAITDQSGSTETFRYDREGRQIQHTDRKGTVTDTKYNIYGQPVLQACTDKKGRRHVMGTWEYDDFGNLTKAVAGGFSYTYEYTPDGRLINKYSSGKKVQSCSYYRSGSLKSMTDASGKTLFYEYNSEGRLKSLKDDSNEILTAYRYTMGGRIKEITTKGGIRTTYEYDDDGNISRLMIGDGTRKGRLYDAFMLYDLNGSRTEKRGIRQNTEGECIRQSISYRYDHSRRLIKEERTEKGRSRVYDAVSGNRYTYDLNGNRLTKESYHNDSVDEAESYQYNERNELTKRTVTGDTASITLYHYDNNGSIISEEQNGRTSEYRYDLLNRQTYVRTLDGKEQENFYDGEGLRAGLAENGKKTIFLYHNGEILTESDGESAPVRRYLNGIGLSHVQTLEDGLYHAYHQDEQGNTAYITEENRQAQNSYRYDAFGNLLERKEDIENRIFYTGQQYDQVTGQYYLRARYYNPVVGRFLQEDAYRGDGLNLYAYCANNPVMYYDPSGHDTEGCGNPTAKDPEKPLAGEVSNEGGSKADLGNKLDYQFGNAGGDQHNIDRTNGLKAEMDKLGFADTAENRAYFQQYYNDVLNDSSNIVGVPQTASYTENGVTHYYTVTTKESFLMGEYGGAKVTTYWDENRLLTIIIGSGKQTRYNH